VQCQSQQSSAIPGLFHRSTLASQAGWSTWSCRSRGHCQLIRDQLGLRTLTPPSNLRQRLPRSNRAGWLSHCGTTCQHA